MPLSRNEYMLKAFFSSLAPHYLITCKDSSDKSILTLGRTRKVKPPSWYKGREGEIDETLPSVFDALQYFETILPSVESL